jgi:hypothetical protein
MKKNVSGGDGVNEFIPTNIEFAANSKSQEEEKILKLVISVGRALSISERIGIMWEQIGGPFAFFYGIIAGLSPWIIKEVKKRINKK